MSEKRPQHHKHSADKKLVGKARFSKNSLLVFCVIFAAVGAYIIWRSFAAPPPPTVYLSPATQTVGGSTTFTVQVRENSGATAVNTVQANLTYDSTLIDYVSIDPTGSAFPTEAQATGGGGNIGIARGTCGGCATLTGDQLVATITFKSKTTSGAAAVNFASGTLLLSSSTNLDILGSLAATAGGTYTVDVTPPTVSITAPANGATLAQGSTVSVTANASDSTSSIAKVEFYVDGALAATDTVSPYSYSWDTTGLSLTSHSLQAKAYDTAGNTASSTPPVSVTLADQTAPTTPGSFHSTSNTATTVNLAWNASTDNVGVTNYKLKRGGTLIATLPSTQLSYGDTGLTIGTSYTYTLTAVDAASNASAPASLTLTTTAKIGDIWGPHSAPDGFIDGYDYSRVTSKYGTNDPGADMWGPSGVPDGIVNGWDAGQILPPHYGT